MVFALFFLSLVLCYSIHYNYPLPAHSDEYDHLAIISEMDATEKTVWYDPYVVEKRSAKRNLELNYDIFLLSFSQLTGIDLPAVPLVVPVFITFMLSLSTFVLVRYVTKKELAAFFSALFVLFLHNSIALLGYWFLVPMAFGLATIPVITYLFLRGLTSWRYAIFLYLVIINMALMHAVYVIIFIPVFFLFLLLTPNEWKRNLPKIVLGTIILLALSARFVRWDIFNLPLTMQKIIEFLVWPYGANMEYYPLIPYIPLLALLLCLAGLAYLLLPLFRKAREKFSALFLYANQKEEFLHYAKFFLLFLLVLFLVRVFADSTGTCLLGPCRRTTPGLAVMALAVAGIGLYSFVRFLHKLIKGEEAGRARLLSELILLALLAFFAHQLMTEPFARADALYHNIELQEVGALKWISENSSKDAVVMALPWAAKPAYLLAERKVVETGAARLGENLELLQDITDFYGVSTSCEQREKTLETRKPDVVYGGEAYIDCKFLDLAYNKGGYYVYYPN